MNCQDALDLLYDIIDREASEIDTQKVKEHLENCRDCFEVYRLEQSVQEFINEKIKHAASLPKVEHLKSKILDRLDEIDKESPGRRQPRFFRLTTRTLVAAASLVILVGAGLLLAAFYRHNGSYLPLEQAHWTATENMNVYSDGDATAQVLAAVQREYAYDLKPQVSDFQLVGGTSEEIMGIRMAHFVYADDDRLISVFVAPSDEFEIPSDLKDSQVVRHNITFFDHNCRGCRLVYHQVGSLVIITATVDRDVELLDFLPGDAVV
ncbi:MAG: zf-HC2 domain-containing protein [Candidatus Zixiibacteriota bacterium]